MSNGTGIKKRLCNPPAEMVASAGDYKIQGMFQGAGEAFEHIEDEGVKSEYAKRVVEIEERYMHARQAVADNAAREMTEANQWLMSNTEWHDKDKDDRRPGSEPGR